MRAGRWLRRRRHVERIAPAVQRVLPAVEGLQVTAVDRPAFREGAEAMRAEVLRILQAESISTEDGCHPVWHELGVHAPIGYTPSTLQSTHKHPIRVWVGCHPTT